jgi:hypothetical protein
LAVIRFLIGHVDGLVNPFETLVNADIFCLDRLKDRGKGAPKKKKNPRK